MASVQIPQELLYDLFKYFLLDSRNPETEAAIRKSLGEKYEAMKRRGLYTQSQTAETPAQREAARQAYLDEVGMKDSFRWSEAEQERRKNHE